LSEETVRILLVEDNPAEARLLSETLRDTEGRFSLAHAETLAGAVAMLAAARFDAVLLDLSLPDSRGLATIARANAAAPDVAILILTGMDDEALALEAIRHGAQDYLVKGKVDARLMARAVRYARERKLLEAARLQAEEAMRRSEYRFRQAVDNLPDAFVIYDDRRRVQFINTVGLALAGRSLEEVLGRTDEEIWPPAITSQYVPALTAALATRSVQQIEASLSFPGGRDVALAITYVPQVDGAGRVEQVLAITHDMTEHRAAERSREEADRRKDEFLANISHELRTPMNAILGMTELALEEAVSPTVRDYLQTVKGSADVLLALLNEILDYSRIQSGKLMVETVPFGLRATLETTLKTLAIPAHEKGLELVCDVPCRVPDLLVGDPLRLRQVLMNLLGNAIKFTHHGEVCLHARALVETPDAVQLEFAVADTGIGISDDDLEKIFTPFTQVDASTTRRYGGTGLGLSIASSLAGMMNGDLRVESRVGQGSTFYFTVPFGRQPGPDPGGSSTAAERLQGTRVLVVEPNASNRRVLEEMLRDWGLQPQAVADPDAAIAALPAAAGTGRPPGLAIVDGRLPWAERLAAAGNPEASLASIILLSSAERQRAHSPAYPARALFLEKPVMGWELLAAIGRATGKVREPRKEPPAAVAGPARPLRVLLAEDTPANQKVVATVLAKRGHQVDLASDGQRALELLGANDYDLVLMDVQMPVLDGFQATAAIRALSDRAKATVPIVALTAHAMKGDAERCLASGMDAYIAKPIDTRELTELVERLACVART
jgi:PAS domain S-box-containing protein